MRLTALAMTALVLAGASAHVLAHHSFAMFDQSRSVTLQGIIKDFRWANPHVFIQLLAAADTGDPEEWSIEMTSREHLSRAGWRPGTLKTGDKVTLVIHPMRDSTKRGQYLFGTGPNGPLSGSAPTRGAHRSGQLIGRRCRTAPDDDH